MRIAGSLVSSLMGLHFAIDMNQWSVQRLVNSPEGRDLSDDGGRSEIDGMIACRKGMSDRQQAMSGGDVLR